MCQIAPAATGDVACSAKAGDVAISIPSPDEGYSLAGSEYDKKLDLLVPNQNRLLCAFIANSDVKRLDTVTNWASSGYMMIEVSRSAENLDISPAQFQEVVSGIKEGMKGELFKGATDKVNEELGRKLKDAKQGSTVLGKPITLGTLFESKDVYSFAMVMPVSNTSGTSNVGMVGVLLRIKEHLVFVYLYKEYTDENTIISLKKIAEKWSHQIQEANAKTENKGPKESGTQ